MVEQALLREAVQRPGNGGHDHQRNAETESLGRLEQERQPAVEEEQQSRHQHRKADPLTRIEALAEHEYAAEDQQQRRELDHDLGDRRRRVIEREEIQHVVAHQRDERDREERKRDPARVPRPGQLAAPGEKGAEAEHRHREAPPGDRPGVQAGQRVLERDRQHAPQDGGRERHRQADAPVTGSSSHVPSYASLPQTRGRHRWRNGWPAFR